MERNFVQKSITAELLYQQQALHCEASGTGNSAKDNIIVSLTSFGQRIDNVFLTIESLFQQTLKADKVILWLSVENFPNKEDDLPLILKRQQARNLDIRFVEGDTGPYKKIIYTALKYPDSLIITVDDDILYPIDLIERLYKSYLKNPQAIHSNRGHRIGFDKNHQAQPYCQWEKSINDTAPALDIFPTGNAGVIYFPGCFHTDVGNETLFMQLAPNADDIWLKAMSLLNDVKCQVTQDSRHWKSRFLTIQGTQAHSLFSENKNKLGGNDDKLKAVFDHYQLWDKFSR